jgi:hypothetical protein
MNSIKVGMQDDLVKFQGWMNNCIVHSFTLAAKIQVTTEDFEIPGFHSQ